MRKILFIIIAIIISSCGTNSSESSSATVKSNDFTVENVKVKKDYAEAWTVVGMIRNGSSSSVKGAVNIKFLNAKGDIVYSTRARVNDGGAFKPGQAASFDYTTSPSDFDGVTSFDVEFYEN
tara:strand:- start:98 stop:463 length:366 start_codon:yes stop_codon:yes gene_type:complete